MKRKEMGIFFKWFFIIIPSCLLFIFYLCVSKILIHFSYIQLSLNIFLLINLVGTEYV